MLVSSKNNTDSIGVLVFGDIYGRKGRKIIAQELPKLQKKYTPDFTITNIENITSGRGPIEEHAQYISKL